MDDVGRWILVLLFLLIGFYFYGMASALTFTDKGSLRKELDEIENPAKSLTKLLEEPLPKRIMLLSISAFISLGVAGLLLLDILSKAMGTWGWYQNLSAQEPVWLPPIVWILKLVVVLFVILLLGVALPQRIFTQDPEQRILSGYPLCRLLSLPFQPFALLTLWLANGLASLFGVRVKGYEDEVTEETIRSLVEAGSEIGAIEQEEQEMINNIFDFDDRTAADLMTHRTEVVAVDINSKISDIVYFAINKGFSRIPVYEEDIDNIKGIIYVKDLLCLVGCTSCEDFKIGDFLRKAIYVPEAMKGADLFQMFKAKKAHMAIVVDDYGGTSGIVSMEDLLESIVGNIQDEYDHEQEEIVKVDEKTYLLSGTADLEEVGKTFDVEFEVDEDTATIGGLIVELLERIPDENEKVTVEANGISFTVLEVEDQRIKKVRAIRQVPEKVKIKLENQKEKED